MPRKLFCELGPWAWWISLRKVRALRHARNLLSRERIARQKDTTPLPVKVHAHKLLLRRTLGEVDMRMQENKAHNLALAAAAVNGLLIAPGETFSFWALVGNSTTKKGYREGPYLSKSQMLEASVGGGICQLTNVLHWLALHSPLDITEHHHHDHLDLFPMPEGTVPPFGCNTSINYNNLDYRLCNGTEQPFQLLCWTDETHLHGELRTDKALPLRWSISETESRFVREADGLYRVNALERRTVDPVTGKIVARKIIRRSHAKVMYDEAHITGEIH